MAIGILGAAAGSLSQQWRAASSAEEEGRPTASIEAADGGFTASVPAALVGEILEDASGYSMGFELGTGSTASCSISKEALPLAATFARDAEAITASLGTTASRRLVTLEAGAWESAAFVRASWRAGDTGFEQAIAVKDGKTIRCRLPGHERAAVFDRFVRSLVVTLAYPRSPPATLPDYREIVVMRASGKPIGISLLEIRHPSAEETIYSVSTATFVKASESSVVAGDGNRVERSAADGSLLEAHHFYSSGGELRHALRIRRSSDAGWLLEGIYGGAALTQPLEGGEPTSLLQQTRALRHLTEAGSLPAAITLQMWMGFDLLRTSPATWTLLARGAPGHWTGQQELGAQTYDVTVDAAGHVVRASLRGAPVETGWERVHVSGAFPSVRHR